MIKKLHEVKKELDILNEVGIEIGKDVGWTWDQFPYTVKLGSTTYIAGAPACGKSEFWFEILINLSCLHGWNHVIYSPETGTHVDVYSEIMHKFVGKPYIKGKYMMNENEKLLAERFVSKHFYIMDDQSDITINQFYNLIEKFEKDNNIEIHTTTVDPWNELREDFLPEDLGREDKYLSRLLGIIRKHAKANNKHHCIITHVRDQRAEKTKEGTYYYPMPTARDLAGGQVWFRKGMSMLMFWRPPVDIQTFDNGFATDNELHVRIAKTKPKRTSKNGTYKFFLNTKAFRYYVKDITELEIYANRGEHGIDVRNFKDSQPIPQPIEQYKPLNPDYDFDKPNELAPF